MKLFAFVTLKPSDNASMDDDAITLTLADHLQSHLDPYKLPKKIKILKSFPKTHLGKINRGAL